MKVWSRCPRAGWVDPGELWVTDDLGGTIFGPVPCRGKADSAEALEHGNADRDPTLPYGDHPSGRYEITQIVRDPAPAHSFGPAFLHLEPVAGEAMDGKANGRTGLGIHGGDPGTGLHRLRATDGCLRVDNGTARVLADLLEGGLPVEYECLKSVDAPATARSPLDAESPKGG